MKKTTNVKHAQEVGEGLSEWYSLGPLENQFSKPITEWSQNVLANQHGFSCAQVYSANHIESIESSQKQSKKAASNRGCQLGKLSLMVQKQAL